MTNEAESTQLNLPTKQLGKQLTSHPNVLRVIGNRVLKLVNIKPFIGVQLFSIFGIEPIQNSIELYRQLAVLTNDLVTEITFRGRLGRLQGEQSSVLSQ